MSTAKLVVIVALAGAVAFGGLIAYLAYANDSFPSQKEPFQDYAQVASYSFNGTEIAFHLTWENGSATPLYSQLNSPSSDAANTPVCDIGLQSASPGQDIFLPFNISPTSATLSNVNLYIAVRAVATGAEFTIVYNLASVPATNASIVPSDIACQQPAPVE